MVKILGNTIKDVVNTIITGDNKTKKPKLTTILVTLHRKENVQNPTQLLKIIEDITDAANKGIIFHWIKHHTTEQALKKFHPIRHENIKFLEPLKYPEMLQKISEVTMVLTDSGGLQEETAILGTPCITYRSSTERPETIMAKTNYLHNGEKSLHNVITKTKFLTNKDLYITGASQKIAQIICEYL